MIQNSEIKPKNKKNGSGKSNTLAVGDERLLWLYVSSSPSQEERREERSRGGRGGLSESTCFLREMRETGTVVASLMSLGSVRCKHRTHTQTHECKREQTHIYTRRESCALGEARFQSAFKWCCAKSPYIIVRIYI